MISKLVEVELLDRIIYKGEIRYQGGSRELSGDPLLLIISKLEEVGLLDRIIYKGEIR